MADRGRVASYDGTHRELISGSAARPALSDEPSTSRLAGLPNQRVTSDAQIGAFHCGDGIERMRRTALYRSKRTAASASSAKASSKGMNLGDWPVNIPMAMKAWAAPTASVSP
jgi:hypothetical protein